mmetsp:Transcript_61015/g.89480  ORF Transcript_61015/g.89480 Transcript_61015/m.89480 type:complete len:152 (+) Transcript_61015:1058-1513(+)
MLLQFRRQLSLYDQLSFRNCGGSGPARSLPEHVLVLVLVRRVTTTVQVHVLVVVKAVERPEEFEEWQVIHRANPTLMMPTKFWARNSQLQEAVLPQTMHPSILQYLKLNSEDGGHCPQKSPGISKAHLATLLAAKLSMMSLISTPSLPIEE